MASSRKSVRWLVGSITVVFGGLLIVCARLGLLSASSQLDEELKLAEQQGLPLTLADLHLSSVPEDQNAGPLLVNAVELMKTQPGDPVTVLSHWGSTYFKPTVSDKAASIAVEVLRPILDIAVRASKRPHLKFELQWEDGTLMVGDAYPVKQLAKGLVARAHVQRNKRDYDAAIDSLDAASRLGRLLSESPGFLAMDSRQAIEAIVAAEAANLLRQCSTTRVVAGIRHILADFGEVPSLRNALKGDFIRCRIYISHMPYAGESGPMASSSDTLGPDEWKLMRLKAVRDLNEANYVKIARLTYAAVPSSSGTHRQVEDAFKDIEKTEDSFTKIGDMAASKLPFVGEATIDFWLECIARRRILSAALDIFEVRSKNGTFPATWSKPGLEGSDPFSEKPLSYRRVGSGFVLYSFGRDRQDDGGRPYTLDDGKYSKDISFEYPKLSVRPVKPVKLGPPGSSGD